MILSHKPGEMNSEHFNLGVSPSCDARLRLQLTETQNETDRQLLYHGLDYLLHDMLFNPKWRLVDIWMYDVLRTWHKPLI